MSLRNKFYLVGIAFAGTVLAACSSGSSSSDEGSSGKCNFVTAAVQQDVTQGLEAVFMNNDEVSSGELVSSAKGCTQRFTSGDEWVELDIRVGEQDLDNELFPAGEIGTDGVQTSQITLADGEVVTVIASSSSPASISTWDASLVGVSAFSNES